MTHAGVRKHKKGATVYLVTSFTKNGPKIATGKVVATDDLAGGRVDSDCGVYIGANAWSASVKEAIEAELAKKTVALGRARKQVDTLSRHMEQLGECLKKAPVAGQTVSTRKDAQEKKEEKAS